MAESTPGGQRGPGTATTFSLTRRRRATLAQMLKGDPAGCATRELEALLRHGWAARGGGGDSDACALTPLGRRVAELSSSLPADRELELEVAGDEVRVLQVRHARPR